MVEKKDANYVDCCHLMIVFKVHNQLKALFTEEGTPRGCPWIPDKFALRRSSRLSAPVKPLYKIVASKR